MTRVKICGIKEIEHAVAAAEAGTDFIGMVFALSKRRVTPEKARLIAAAIRKLPHRPALVGVFVNAPAAAVNQIAADCQLNWVQLSGEEPWQYCRGISLPVIQVLHVPAAKNSPKITHNITTGLSICREKKLICLLDTQATDAHGGTGQTFDWRVAQEVAARYPLMVAGGLTPDNVVQLMQEVHPWGVDVSSGVETDGKKDIAKIKAFIKAVRAAG
ncbi:phosphoribosylanthranilate isomerase [Chloroflexota bacterium]